MWTEFLEEFPELVEERDGERFFTAKFYLDTDDEVTIIPRKGLGITKEKLRKAGKRAGEIVQQSRPKNPKSVSK